MSYTVFPTQFSLESRQITCWCGVPFAIPNNVAERFFNRTINHLTCPVGGHALYPKGETEEARLRRELEAKQRLLQVKETMLQDERKRRESLKRSRDALRGVVTRTKHRAAAGVCPVKGCKRHFRNLQRHIETKHPTWRHEQPEK